MTNTQNIRTTIAQLMREKWQLEPALKEAEEQNSRAYKEVIDWEETYMISGENEEVGRTLDKVYDEYNKINEVMHKTKEQVEAIKKAIETLRKVADTIEWLGL